MFTREAFREFVADLEALGLDPGLAGECAAFIGDTPCNVGGDIWVNDRVGTLIAVIPARRLNPEERRLWRWKESPDVILARGKVDRRAEHIALRSGRRILARLAPKDPARPEAGLFLLEWLIPPRHPNARNWSAEVGFKLSTMLTTKGERYPWAYLCHHCGTTGNCYSGENGRVYFAKMPGKTPRQRRATKE